MYYTLPTIKESRGLRISVTPEQAAHIQNRIITLEEKMGADGKVATEPQKSELARLKRMLEGLSK